MFRAGLAVAALLAACGGDGSVKGPAVTTEHCQYEPLSPTARAGGTVEAGPLEAGAAEAVLEVPVGTALGAYTARAGFIGTAGEVDVREVAIPEAFNPSIGVETAPMAKALALSAGGETVVLLKADLGLVYEGMLLDLEEQLGADFHGKVILTASHSHSAWGQQSGNSIYKVGLGEFSDYVYGRYLGVLRRAVESALEARRPAAIGVHADLDFDPDDRITRDRRPENDPLMGGAAKDSTLFMLRVDGLDGAPIAAVPIYGIHGTLLGPENSLASTDAIGATERLLAEQFDSEVVVMHLQGAGADVAPAPRGSLDCEVLAGDEGDPCFQWLKAEGNARAALPMLMEAWEAAGSGMQTDIELEMMSRSIELGPEPENFTVRGGALSYAPFEPERVADGEVFGEDGALLSPIDEFNAPVGAALCETESPLFPAGQMPGTQGIAPYGSCVRVDVAADVLGDLLSVRFESDETHPVCQSTRTTVSALRLGDYLVGTVPGELSVLLAERIRETSPAPADQTILLGYAQGHIGYCMAAEDWASGGYEASINVWGPLEAEMVSERLLELLPLALTPEREDAAAGGADRVSTPAVNTEYPIDDPAPMAGTIPDEVPEQVWLRTGSAASAQPPPTLPRVSGHATFVWIGDDPMVKTPVVTLERETASGSGAFTPALRRSGRPVRDGAVLLSYTPQPLALPDAGPRTHYWSVEWQAVPWIGAEAEGGASLDGLGARAGVPLGRYRFSVQGDGWELFSDPFEVVPAELGAEAAQNAAAIEVTLTLHDPLGYRLLDVQAPSNRPVPIRAGTFTVELALAGGGTESFSDVAIDAAGLLSVEPAADPADVTSVTITDRFGNRGTASL